MKQLLLSFMMLAVSGIITSAQGYKCGHLDMTPGFSRYAKNYVEEHINQWQVKGEFEKTADYNARITGQRDAKIQEYLAEAKEMYIKDRTNEDLRTDMTLSRYDADNEIFIVSHPKFEDLIVRIAPSEAPDFKNEWPQMTVSPQYELDGDFVVLARAQFNVLKKGKVKKSYVGIANKDNIEAAPEIVYNFNPIELDLTSVNQAVPSSSAIDNVDLNVPKSKLAKNDNTFAVIIANENYRRVSNVDFAYNDGEAVRNYLINTLGVPAGQIHMVKDATLNDLRGELEWIQEVGNAYNGDASFIFYYAGHGIPDESSGDGYLLPSDGFGARISSAMPLSELNSTFGIVKSRYSIVMLDACFSGAARSGDMVAAARGVVIKAKPGKIDSGNVIFITASKDDETAAKYDDARHGLFTYHLLRKLKDTQGDVKLGELSDYLIDEVNRVSIVTNRKSQTPSVIVSPTLRNNWQTIKLNGLSK